jgi:molecular chaperone GrpE
MNPDHEEPRVVVNDKRRIDPETGSLRSPFAAPGAPDDPAQAAQPITATLADSEELASAKQEAAERTADLQRVSAEYANYRKRVDRDREATVTAARARVLTELLTVLDDVDRAEAHGELTGGFKTVAEKLTGILSKQGLARIGEKGEPFDPARHEAVHFATSSEVTEQVVTEVLRHGYTVDDKLVRPAVVVVTGPEHETGQPPASEDAAAE